MILSQSTHASPNIKFLGGIEKEIMHDRILINVSDKINTKNMLNKLWGQNGLKNTKWYIS
jgi:hypothetical protein